MYIGKTPTVGNFQKCDAITTSATATFNLLVGAVAVSPETSNHCIVSLNGVIQAPTDAFTISGSTIVFNSALTTADVIDFILILGNVLDIGTPSDNTVSLAKLASGTDGNIISYDASGNPVAVATGSSGQILTSAGAGAPPTFAAAAGGGKVAQVVHLAMTAIVTETAQGAWTDITGFSLAITPAATSSKILVLIDFAGGCNRQSGFRAVRATSTALTGGVGDAASSRVQSTKGTLFTGYTTTQTRFSSAVILDEPSSTSAVTYKVQFYNANNTDSFYLNKCSVATDVDSDASHRARSGITLMEITA